MVRTNFKKKLKLKRNNYSIHKELIPTKPYPYIDVTPHELRLAQELAETPDDIKGSLKRAGLFPTANCKDAKRVMQKEGIELWEKRFNEISKSIGFQNAFQNAMMDKVNSMRATSNKVVSFFYQVLTADKAQAYNDDGSLKSFTDIPLQLRQCIQKIEQTDIFRKSKKDGLTKIKGYKTKIEFYSAMDAAKELMSWIKGQKGIIPTDQFGNTFVQNNFNIDQSKSNVIQVDFLDNKEKDVLLKALGYQEDDITAEMLAIEQQGVVNE